MNVERGPGCAAGCERSVDAEPGPMGAGAGAAAAIDNDEPCLRGAAIEKAEAGLSEEEAVCAAGAGSDGDASGGSDGCEEGSDEVSVDLAPRDERSCSGVGPVDVGAGDPSRGVRGPGTGTDIDGCEGVHGGPKGGGHVNRDRVRSRRLGDGHALAEEGEGGDGRAAERESTGDEDMVDMSFQVLPHQSQHGLPSKWAGLGGSQEYEPVSEIMARRGPASEQHPREQGSRDRAAVPAVKSAQASDVRGGSRAAATGRDAGRSTLAGECSPCDLAGECSPCDLADAPDGEERAGGVGEGRDGRAGGRQGGWIREEDAIGGDGAGGALEGAGRRDGASPAAWSTGVGVEKPGEPGAGSREPSGSVQGKHGSAARAEQEKKASVQLVRVKVEDGVDEARARPPASQAEAGRDGIHGADSQELRTGAQAGAAVGGAPRSMGRAWSNSGTPRCKHPGVVPPWEKGQDSAVQAEAERQSAGVRERLANKAREDFILEEAAHLKAKRKQVEERKTTKPFAEPARRKVHWDFVLEEMKWMANDFWQERMWKRYQAAHVCLEVATRKGEEDFVAADLAREQHRVSRVLASAVKGFWQSAEVAATKERSDGRGWGPTQAARRRSESEAVPMDVDFPAAREGPEKAARREKAGKEQWIGVQEYAVVLLRESGFLGTGQAEPPATPERRRESSSILEQVREVPLLYEVPMGSMEAYRAAVEGEHARSEEEYERRRAAEAEALAAEAADDAGAGGDGRYAKLSNDGGSQEDEPAMFMAGIALIARKKRKKILKTSSIGSRGEGSAPQGAPFRAAGSLSSEAGIPSPVVTGKRTLTGGSGASSLLGSIPVKRARSSAANLRPRGTQPGASPGGYMAQRGGGPQFQQEDGMDAPDGSSQGDVGSDTPGSRGVGGDGRLRKKKKTRPYPGLSFSDGGAGADSGAKGSEGGAADVRHEQMKRKADTHWVSIGGFDAGPDTPGTPGSQGPAGQLNSKKQKSLRPGETNSEVVQAGQQVGSAAGASKLLRQSSMRDRNRRVRPAMKVPPSTPSGGVGIPWSAGEDQAILALVHDLGANWDLVSDVLSSNSQIKGICRKPQQCKERHKALTERAGSEGLENPEDPSSSQAQASKGNPRGPRGQSAAEEDTLKHLEQIVTIVQKYGARKNSSESEDQKVLQASHSSHGVIVSQFWTGIGGTSNPVDLADRATGSDDPGGHLHPAQPAQGNALGPPIVGPMPGLGMRPPGGGLPLVLPGPNGLHGLGQGSLSPAAMSAAAARDAQRLNMSSMGSLSNEDHARLQMATKQLTDYNARRAQQQAASAASGVPALGGPANSNGLPMLSTSTSGGMLVGLNRGLSLPRAGLAGMGSPVVSGMGTGGLSGRLPPSGNLAASNVSRRIAGLVNMARSGGCTEEQRVQALQQLQSMAQQGDGQAGGALASLTGGGGGEMGSPVDGLNQPFSLHHQHPLQQQQQQLQQAQEQHQQQLHQQQLHHMNNSSSKLQAQVQQHSHQMQLAGAPQAYGAVPTRMKEQQQQHPQLQRHQQLQQQQQQQQQKQKLVGNLAPGPQPQHMLAPPHQAGAASVGGQHLKAQPHILPPQQHNSLQKQLMQQVGSPSQGAQLVGVASSSLQSSPASPGKSGQASTAGQVSERAGQMAQGPAGAKAAQPSQGGKQAEQTSQMLQQRQQQQQQAMRNSRGVSRGAMVMQGPGAQAAQASGAGGGGNGQLQAEAVGQMHAGQRGAAQGQGQAGKAASGSQTGQAGGGQVHGAQQSQALSCGAGAQKGGQQQSAQGGVGKQQQGVTSQAGGQGAGQRAGPGASSGQQAAAAASSGTPNQQPQQAQRRGAAQPQPPRRLQTKHPSASVGAGMPGQLAKMGAQAAGQGAPSPAAAGGQNAFQFVGTIPMGTSNPTVHGIPPPAALSSSAVEAQGPQWKANQALPPLGGGMYNLTRTSSPGPGQGPAVARAGVHSNGNMGAPSVCSAGVQGVGAGSAAQGPGGVRSSPGSVGQKGGAGMSGRGSPESLAGVVGGQRSQGSSWGPLPSGAGNTASREARPPAASSASASRTSSGGVGVPQDRSGGGPHEAGSAGTAGATASGGQRRQALGEHASSSGGVAPSPARGANPGASGSASSESTIPPRAGGEGGPPAVEATAGCS